MKLRIVLTTLTAALTLAFSGCSKSEADEKAAVESFKQEAKGLEAWMEEKKKGLATNPMAGLAMMKELVAKLKAMKSEDLPEDLKAAWGDFVTKISKMEGLLAEIGTDPTALIKKAQEDPKFMQTFGEKMQALEAEVRPAAQKLAEVGKKYGIEKIGELAPK